MRHIAPLLFQQSAYVLKYVAYYRVEVHSFVVALLQKHAAVIPAEQPLGSHEGLGAVAYLAVLSGGRMGHQIVRNRVHSIARPGGHGHHRRVRVQRADEGQALLQLGRAQEVRLVQHDEVGLGHLRVEQKTHLRRQVYVPLALHEHTHPLRVHDAGEGHELELIPLALRELEVDVVERAYAAAGDVRENDCRARCRELTELVHQVLVLVADAVACNAGGEHLARRGVVRVHDVASAEVVGEDGSLAPARVYLAGEGEHGGGLAGSEEAARYHVFSLWHSSPFPLSQVRQV